MDGISTILSWDKSLFLFVNNSCQNPLFDWLMPRITRFENFIIVLLVLALLLLWKGRARGRVFVIAAILLLSIVDRGNSDIVKPLFMRPRPYDTMIGIRWYKSQRFQITSRAVVEKYKNTRSFPSTHAVNIWAMAVLAGLFYRRLIPILFSFAALVAFSRVYIGHHYPLDILGGACLGAGAGITFYHLTKYIIRKVDKQQRILWEVFPKKPTP